MPADAETYSRINAHSFMSRTCDPALGWSFASGDTAIENKFFELELEQVGVDPGVEGGVKKSASSAFSACVRVLWGLILVSDWKIAAGEEC